MHRRSLLAAPFCATAQTLRPIRLIAPFPPGGAADAIARITAEAWTSQTGQAVVVENRAGANGVLGVGAVARAAPDGATLGVLNVTFFTAIRQMMNRLPYDPDRDLTPISRIVTSTLLCCVEAGRARQRGWTDFRRLIEEARRTPLTKGSAGSGSTAHLLIAVIARRTGAEIVHVPYRGGAPALNDLMAGSIDMVFDQMPALMPLVAAGRLVPLAVGSRERVPLLPDVPGMGEFADLGLGDLDLQSWNAVTGPGGMAPGLVASLHQGILRAAAAPGLAERFGPLGLTISTYSSPDAVRADIACEAPAWAEMVRLSGARMD